MTNITIRHCCWRRWWLTTSLQIHSNKRIHYTVLGENDIPDAPVWIVPRRTRCAETRRYLPTSASCRKMAPPVAVPSAAETRPLDVWTETVLVAENRPIPVPFCCSRRGNVGCFRNPPENYWKINKFLWIFNNHVYNNKTYFVIFLQLFQLKL